MTIQNTVSRVVYAGANTTGPFAIPFLFYATTDLTLQQTSSTGVITTLVLNVDYTLTGTGVATGGTATTTVAVPVGAQLAIFLNPPLTQLSQYVDGQPFPSDTIQQDFDRSVQISQRLQAQINFAVRAPDADNNPSMVLPAAVVRAGQYLAFDGAGNVVSSVGTGNDTALRSDLANTTTAGKGNELISIRRTAAEIAEGVTPVNYFYPDGHLWRFMTSAQITDVQTNAFTLDCTTAIQNWLKCAPKFGGTNGLGELYAPPGRYKVTGALTIYTTMKLRCDGVLFDFSTAAANITAVTLTGVNGGIFSDPFMGEPLGGLNLTGPGNATASIALKIENTAGTGFPSKFEFRPGQVTLFGVGLQPGNNSWSFTCNKGWFFSNGINAYFPSGLTNAAEQVEFRGTSLSSSVTCSLRSYGNSLDIRFFGGSMDYDASTAIDISGDTIVTCFGTHFENSGDKYFVRNVPASGNPQFNAWGCTWTQGSGSATVPLIDATQVHCVVDGGWYRGGGTQATFIKSTGAYDLKVGPIPVVSGTITAMTNIAGGTGNKQIWTGGSSGNHYFGKAVQIANAVAEQWLESGGTARDLLKLNSSNNFEIGNSNNGLLLNLKQVVTNYYGFVVNGLGTNFGIYFRTAAGAPPGTEVGIEQGSLLLNQADKKLYVNTGTSASATWTAQA